MATPGDHRHLDDEALSSVLDGEAPEEAARAASGCAVCAARLEAFGAVAAAVASPAPAPAPEARRRAIGAALASLDSGANEPTRLAAPRRRVLAPWMAAAAVVIAGALAVPLVDRVMSSGEDQTLAQQQEAQDDLGGDGCPGCGPTADEAAGSEPSPLAAAPDLGQIDLGRLDQLAAALGDRDAAARDGALDRSPPGTREFNGFDDQPATASAKPGAPIACEAEARRRESDLGPLVAQGQGRVGDRQVAVLAFEAMPAGTTTATRLVVLDAATCAELASTTT